MPVRLSADYGVKLIDFTPQCADNLTSRLSGAAIFKPVGNDHAKNLDSEILISQALNLNFKSKQYYQLKTKSFQSQNFQVNYQVAPSSDN